MLSTLEILNSCYLSGLDNNCCISSANVNTIKHLKLLLILKGFHDCVGGCNGCINFNNPDNNGLSLAVDTLNNIYTTNNFQTFGASRADFWAMAASVALSVAVRASNRQRNNDQICSPQSCTGP